MPRKASKIRGKSRKTFSLSTDVVGYLEQLKKVQDTASLTATLEMLVREDMRRRELERLDAEAAAYYASLSEEEQKADNDWGAFAETELRKANESR